MSLLTNVGAQLMRVPGATFAVKNPVLTEMLGLTALAGGLATWSLFNQDDGPTGQARSGARSVGS